MNAPTEWPRCASETTTRIDRRLSYDYCGTLHEELLPFALIRFEESFFRVIIKPLRAMFLDKLISK